MNNTKTIITMCGWCNKVKVNGQYYPENHEVAIAYLASKDYVVSHGICRICREKFQNEKDI